MDWGFGTGGLGLGLDNVNKTKYFKLRLSDEVDRVRPETDQRQTDLRQTYERKMKIQSFRQVCAGQTDGANKF